MSDDRERQTGWRKVCWPLLETLAVLGLFALYGGGDVPHVNEAHYLCKAKHFWDPQFAPGDLFLSSAEAHWVFYLAFGWPTLWLSLEEVAWVGRLTGWLMLAASWVHLSRAINPRRGLSVLTGASFAFLVQYTPMSGEWVLGGIEAKVVAYALVICGLASIAQDRWKSVWPAFGLAASFHVLVGGWAVVAAIFVWCASGRKRPSWKETLPWLALGGALSLPGLLPAILLSMDVDPKTAARANAIYVMERLPHHLRFSAFKPHEVAAHFVAMVVTVSMLPILFANRSMRRVLLFALAAIGLSLMGIIIDQWTLQTNDRDLAASLLRFYWFRLSDATLPMVIAIGVPLIWSKTFAGQRWAPWAGIAVVGLLVSIDVGKRCAFHLSDPPPSAVRQSIAWGQGDQEEKCEQYREWRKACRWVRTHTDSDAVFLTPRSQQTFKWYAQRAEYVNWKDVPQDAKTLVEWWRRLTEIYDQPVLGPLNFTDEALEDLVRQHGIDYIMVPRDDAVWRADQNLPLRYPRVYPEPGADGPFYIFDARHAPLAP